MLSHALRLELVKHRASFVGTAIVSLIGVMGIALGGIVFGKWDWIQGLSGAVAMMVFGIPVFALLFGSMTGTNLRREPERGAEEPLPVHPIVRVGAAFLAGLLYFLAIAVLMPALFAFDDVANYAYQGPLMQLIFGRLFWWLVLGTLHLYALSFLFSYWLKQPILGSGLALLIGALEVYFPYQYLIHLMQDYYDTNIYFGEPPSLSTTPFALYIGAGLILTCAAIGFLANRAERGKRLGLLWSAAIVWTLSLSLLFAGLRLYFMTSASRISHL